MNLLNCPCKECTDRQIKCHSTCQRYKHWRKEYDEAKEKYNAQSELENSLNTYEIDRSRRIYKKYKYAIDKSMKGKK